MVKHNDAFFRFFLKIAGHPPRFLPHINLIDEQIAELAHRVRSLKASHRRGRKCSTKKSAQ